MNLCFGERMRRYICSLCFHINRQLTHPFCPVHTQPKQPYKLTGKHSREFKEGDFQRGQTQRGAQPSFVGPPLTPCRRHALQRLSDQSNKPDAKRLPRQHSTLSAAAPREYRHARPSECKRAITRTWVQHRRCLSAKHAIHKARRSLSGK